MNLVVAIGVMMKGIASVEDQNGWIGNAEIHWFEAHGVGRVRWKIKHRFVVNRRSYPYFVVCINARGYEGSLYVGKIYRVIRPHANDLPPDIRVIDEEGEDYLYSANRFVPITLPTKVKRVLGMAR
jgi:hypothetical protein